MVLPEEHAGDGRPREDRHRATAILVTALDPKLDLLNDTNLADGGSRISSQNLDRVWS